MLLRSFDGSILKVAKVELIVEKRDSFNGEVQRRVTVAKDKKQDISGVLFHMAYSGTNLDLLSPCGDILIGNLTHEEVENIMNSMLKNGYVDISGYSYQKQQLCVLNTIFDHGKSKPYYTLRPMIDIGGSGFHQFGGNPLTVQDGLEEEEDIEAEDAYEDAEQMRSDIYAMSDDYTITQLANMSEEELSDILRGLKEEF